MDAMRARLTSSEFQTQKGLFQGKTLDIEKGVKSLLIQATDACKRPEEAEEAFKEIETFINSVKALTTEGGGWLKDADISQKVKGLSQENIKELQDELGQVTQQIDEYRTLFALKPAVEQEAKLTRDLRSLGITTPARLNDALSGTSSFTITHNVDVVIIESLHGVVGIEPVRLNMSDSPFGTPIRDLMSDTAASGGGKSSTAGAQGTYIDVAAISRPEQGVLSATEKPESNYLNVMSIMEAVSPGVDSDYLQCMASAAVTSKKSAAGELLNINTTRETSDDIFIEKRANLGDYLFRATYTQEDQVLFFKDDGEINVGKFCLKCDVQLEDGFRIYFALSPTKYDAEYGKGCEASRSLKKLTKAFNSNAADLSSKLKTHLMTYEDFGREGGLKLARCLNEVRPAIGLGAKTRDEEV